MPVVDAVVLAAGASSRTRPAHKLVADLGGRPVLAWVLDALVGVRDVVVVTSGDPAVEALVGARIVRNPRPEDGMASSLRVGIEALRPGADAVLQVLGDMPLVTRQDVAAVIAAARPDRVVVPVSGGERGHPVAWGASVLPMLLSLDEDGTAADVLEGPVIVEDVPAGEGVLLDVDTPEALDEARRRVARRT